MLWSSETHLDYSTKLEHLYRYRIQLSENFGWTNEKLKSEGIGNTKRQAEPISLEEEEQLWATGQLGMHSPQALLDTIFYLIGVSFGLCGGQEHRQLQWNPPQITVVVVSGERKHLLYVEDVSKNNCGGNQ